MRTAKVITLCQTAYQHYGILCNESPFTNEGNKYSSQKLEKKKKKQQQKNTSHKNEYSTHQCVFNDMSLK